MCRKAAWSFPISQLARNLALGAFLQSDQARIEQGRNFVFNMPRFAGTPPAIRRHALGRRATNAGHRPRADGRASPAHARRALSLGLAPKLIGVIFEKILEINRTRGLAILLVEQNANLALEISQRAYVLETGRMVMEERFEKTPGRAAVESGLFGRDLRREGIFSRLVTSVIVRFFHESVGCMAGSARRSARCRRHGDFSAEGSHCALAGDRVHSRSSRVPRPDFAQSTRQRPDFGR